MVYVRLRDGTYIDRPAEECVGKFYVNYHVAHFGEVFSVTYVTGVDSKGCAIGPCVRGKRLTFDISEVHYKGVEYPTLKELVEAFPNNLIVLSLLERLT